MSETLTLSEVEDIFQDACDEFGKLFIPEPRQTRIIENFIKFYERNYSAEILVESIRYFIEHSLKESILVFDFATDSEKYRDKIIEVINDKKEIEDLMEQTRKRMEGFN